MSIETRYEEEIPEDGDGRLMSTQEFIAALRERSLAPAGIGFPSRHGRMSMSHALFSDSPPAAVPLCSSHIYWTDHA